MDHRLVALRSFALFRCVLGVWILWMALPLLDRSFVEVLPRMLEGYAVANPYEFYRWAIHQVLIPYAEHVGTVLAVAQALVGGALIVGFLTRLVSTLGMLYAINLYLATSHLSTMHQGFAVVLFITFLALALGHVGRCYGVDQFLMTHDEKPGPDVDKIVKDLKKATKKGKKKKRSKAAV